MEQHPIPQNVSSYQFKLVGDMTLKQFFQVAGGVLGGVIFYSTPLLAIIKYPLAILSILLGVGLAFLPFEERPLEKWIFSFFRAIYSPTIYNWSQGAATGRLFEDETPANQNPQQDAALKDYLAKNTQTPTAPSKLDKAEGNFLTNLFGLSKSVQTDTVKTETVSPAPTTITPTPTVQTVQSLPPAPIAAAPIPKAAHSLASMAREITPLEKPVSAPAAQVLRIPDNNATPIPKQNFATNQFQSLYATPSMPTATNTVAPPMSGTNIISTTQALFSVDAAPPTPPTYPNVVVGQVIDQDRRIVEGVIMEIRDSAGRPVRALRSNRAGHFITVTRLDNGHYEIITEKEGYEFNPTSFDAVGAIIPPILIQGKRLSPFIEMPAVPVKPKYSIN